jgi:hypothetical protein
MCNPPKRSFILVGQSEVSVRREFENMKCVEYRSSDVDGGTQVTGLGHQRRERPSNGGLVCQGAGESCTTCWCIRRSGAKEPESRESHRPVNPDVISMQSAFAVGLKASSQFS